MTGEIDREVLRRDLLQLDEVGRRIVIERIVEQLGDDDLRQLFQGIARFEPAVDGSAAPTLLSRIRAHVEATRSGAYRGKYVIRNAHGQREPPQTAIWEATTAHLFDLAFAASGDDLDAAAGANELAALVHEIDDRVDELVVFEDRCASDAFFDQIKKLEREVR